MSENSKVLRRDPATFQWALDERVRLQAMADFLWDELDHFQLEADMQATLNDYNDVCDMIDLLEKSPECLKNGHDWSEDELWPGPDGRVHVHCTRCHAQQRM